MTDALLTADCSQCAALCSVSLAFDKSAQFAIDKAAGQACPKLTGDGLCSIHDTLEDQGFKGCVSYQCNGAGQRVTQDLFGGQSWQNDISILAPMMKAFRVMRRVHELLVLLKTSESISLPDVVMAQRKELEALLLPSGDWTYASLMAFEKTNVEKIAMAFFLALRPYVQKPTV